MCCLDRMVHIETVKVTGSVCDRNMCVLCCLDLMVHTETVKVTRSVCDRNVCFVLSGPNDVTDCDMFCV